MDCLMLTKNVLYIPNNVFQLFNLGNCDKMLLWKVMMIFVELRVIFDDPFSNNNTRQNVPVASYSQTFISKSSGGYLVIFSKRIYQLAPRLFLTEFQRRLTLTTPWCLIMTCRCGYKMSLTASPCVPALFLLMLQRCNWPHCDENSGEVCTSGAFLCVCVYVCKAQMTLRLHNSASTTLADTKLH